VVGDDDDRPFLRDATQVIVGNADGHAEVVEDTAEEALEVARAGAIVVGAVELIDPEKPFERPRRRRRERAGVRPVKSEESILT